MLRCNLKCVRMIVLLYMERIDMLIVFILMGAFFCAMAIPARKRQEEKSCLWICFFCHCCNNYLLCHNNK